MILLIKIFILIFFSLLQTGVLWGAQTVKIGVLAKRGPAYTLQKWSKTADYLSSSVHGYLFEIVPLGFQEIHTAVKEGKIDFVLANSAFYVELEKLYGVSRIATLINQNMPGQQTTTFGGVIFSRADKKDIKELEDLQGKNFMAVDPRSFGGWIMAWREFKRKGIDPLADFSSMQYGTTHDAVVYAVLNGAVDGGTVRSDTLERMAAEGKIKLEMLRILHPQKVDQFPFMISTDLYPEWPIAAIKTTPNKLSRLVASALMAMDAGDPAAIASKSAGWTIPLNYQPVHDCLLELRISPYEDYGKFTLKDVLQRYWRQVALLALAAMAVLVVTLYIFYLNQSLHQKKAEVDELNRTLEVKVIQRTEKINTLLDQEMYLREILHTVADVNELLVTSLTLESLLKESCARFVQHGHYGFCWVGLLENDNIQTVYTSHEADNYLIDPPYALQDADNIFPQSPTAKCIAENRTVISDISRQKVDATPWRTQVKGFQAVIGLPLRADQHAEPLGAMTVYTWRKEGCEPEELAMLEELAGDIGFAINSFQQKEAVTRLELERTANYEETIFSMVNMIEHRDTYTAGHTARVARYSVMIAKEMGLDDKEIQKLQKAAVLHDIGKIATPDSVLLKPGKLSDLDYDLIKIHASAGYEMLSKINMYKELAEIIRHHHERYDGNGYPDHLKDEDIPLLSSIMTVADAFDAMTTNRIYKSRKEIPEAVIELQSLAGSQFNPQVVKAAVNVLQDVKIPSTVSQLPRTDLEKRRFSYFFNDKLTGLYNEDYLQIILRNNRSTNDYKCFYSVHLKNLPEYNKRWGWEEGNQLVKEIADELQVNFPETLLFRAYGNDFAIVTKEHFELASQQIEIFTCIRDAEIKVEITHVDLIREEIYTINKLEKLELLLNKE
ncbi:MAG: PhnD/SsuA/transferrin family substrate-binding protein [Desulfobulbaceae bacterium]|uniref:PhnD/SsuA/transferrin family substrate-binding protein n=1 Tax=Candidatus Desulfobia pelagia TaxID=2841692 RepID=A0A8J6ND57_9BACT|nr:PhnD/SsuA/transferrin family substrate-binding protein [Candidatus Desulfobia pelagia]